MKFLLASNKGFTLLEIMIAITIMGVLSYLTAVSIRNTIDTKTQIQRRIDVSSEIRTALKVIEKDIRSAFNYNNFNYELLTEIKREQRRLQASRNQNQNPNQPRPPNSDAVDEEANPPNVAAPNSPTQDNTKKTITNVIDDYLSQYQKANDASQFIGSNTSLHFTSLNHVRRYADAQESDQMEVGYYLAECRDLLDAEQRSQCLWRRESPFIDDKVDEGGGATVILQNIKSLSFQYKTKKEMEDESVDWRDSWVTDERGDETTKGVFPDVVKVSIEAEIQGRNTKDSIIVPLDFPNNKEKKGNAEAAQTQAR